MLFISPPIHVMHVMTVLIIPRPLSSRDVLIPLTHTRQNWTNHIHLRGTVCYPSAQQLETTHFSFSHVRRGGRRGGSFLFFKTSDHPCFFRMILNSNDLWIAVLFSLFVVHFLLIWNWWFHHSYLHFTSNDFHSTRFVFYSEQYS